MSSCPAVRLRVLGPLVVVEARLWGECRPGSATGLHSVVSRLRVRLCDRTRSGWSTHTAAGRPAADVGREQHATSPPQAAPATVVPTPTDRSARDPEDPEDPR